LLRPALQNLSAVDTWVKEQRVALQDGRIKHYQVNMQVTFVLDE
jgi:dodecin